MRGEKNWFKGLPWAQSCMCYGENKSCSTKVLEAKGRFDCRNIIDIDGQPWKCRNWVNEGYNLLHTVDYLIYNIKSFDSDDILYQLSKYYSLNRDLSGIFVTKSLSHRIDLDLYHVGYSGFLQIFYNRKIKRSLINIRFDVGKRRLYGDIDSDLIKISNVKLSFMEDSRHKIKIYYFYKNQILFAAEFAKECLKFPRPAQKHTRLCSKANEIIFILSSFQDTLNFLSDRSLSKIFGANSDFGQFIKSKLQSSIVYIDRQHDKEKCYFLSLHSINTVLNKNYGLQCELYTNDTIGKTFAVIRSAKYLDTAPSDEYFFYTLHHTLPANAMLSFPTMKNIKIRIMVTQTDEKIKSATDPRGVRHLISFHTKPLICSKSFNSKPRFIKDSEVDKYLLLKDCFHIKQNNSPDRDENNFSTAQTQFNVEKIYSSEEIIEISYKESSFNLTFAHYSLKELQTIDRDIRFLLLRRFCNGTLVYCVFLGQYNTKYEFLQINLKNDPRTIKVNQTPTNLTAKTFIAEPNKAESIIFAYLLVVVFLFCMVLTILFYQFSKIKISAPPSEVELENDEQFRNNLLVSGYVFQNVQQSASQQHQEQPAASDNSKHKENHYSSDEK